MKKMMCILMAVLMSISVSTFAGTTTESNSVENTCGLDIPVDLIVKQIITFKDGKTITVFYQKEGDSCKLYSTTDVTKYKVSDLNRVKATSFEIADKVEGKCRLSGSTGDVLREAKNLLRRFTR